MRCTWPQTAKQMHDAGNLNDLGLANQLAADEEAKANVELADADLQDARENLAGLMGLSDAQANFAVAPRLPGAKPIHRQAIFRIGRCPSVWMSPPRKSL